VRLGATIDDYLASTDPADFVAECKRKGYRASAMPLSALDQANLVHEIAKAFRAADIRLAEITAWVNPLHHEPAQRKKNLETIKRNLALADEVGAVCCATVVGSYCDKDQKDQHAGHHPDNFTQRAFDDVVAWIRDVLDQVRPTRTKLTLEICPWTLLDSPEIYVDLIRSVDRDGLAVHLDPANLVTHPRAYFGTTKMINHCFDLLGQYVCSCHAKDVRWTLDARTVGIEEVVPGRGILDYATFLRRAEQVSPDVPLIIEHIETEANFDEAASYIRRVGSKVGIRL